MSRAQVPLLLKLLYNHNPFYLISAGCGVYGLKLFFKPFEAEYIPPWPLMGSLAAVTLLMALTAFCIVRFGKVWEDARSLVLVLLMMFFATSVSFDEIVNNVCRDAESALPAYQLMAFGWGLAIVVTEGLLRGLSIQLSWWYRVPFYGVLLILFGFPLWVSPEVSGCSPELARWRIAAFPTVAAAMTLLLLPAVRRGRQLVAQNGTPWTWPCFPWCVFVFLALAVCFRSYSLGISFDRSTAREHYWDTSFGLYFLVPFLGSVLVVLFELSVVEGLKKLQDRLLLVGPALLFLSVVETASSHKGWHASRHVFLHDFVQQVASPVFITLCGLMAFYAYAWFRGARQAELGFAGACGLTMFVGMHSHDLSNHVQQYWPLALLGLAELGVGVGRRQSVRTMIALSLAIFGGVSLLSGTKLAHLMVPLAHHGTLFTLVVVTSIYRDSWAVSGRKLAALLLVASTGAAVLTEVQTGIRTPYLPAYVLSMCSICFGCGLLLKERVYLQASLLIVLTCVGKGSWLLVLLLRQIDGALPLVAGGLCFGLAVLISVLKATRPDRFIAQELAVVDSLPGTATQETEI